MDALKTFFDQLAKNVKQAPGWVPLLIVLYVAVQFVAIESPTPAPSFEKYMTVLVPFAAWILYNLGDALDKAVFPRPEENSGCSWLAPSSLDAAKENVKSALSLDARYYKISLSLATSAKKYEGSSLHMFNELAKFVRSGVLPAGMLCIAWLLLGDWLPSFLSFVFALIALLLYGRLKGAHMAALYNEVTGLTKEADYRFTDLENSGIRLHFWKGELIGSGLRRSAPKQHSDNMPPTRD